MSEDHYISELHIDAESLAVTSPEMEHERRVSIFDLLEENSFHPKESESGPYIVNLSLAEDRLVLNVLRTNGVPRGNYSFFYQAFPPNS